MPPPQVKPEPPQEDWKPTKMTLRIVDRNDVRAGIEVRRLQGFVCTFIPIILVLQLWNVCFKSKWARVEIPELEFEISQDGESELPSLTTRNDLGFHASPFGSDERISGVSTTSNDGERTPRHQDPGSVDSHWRNRMRFFHQSEILSFSTPSASSYRQEAH